MVSQPARAGFQAFYLGWGATKAQATLPSEKRVHSWRWRVLGLVPLSDQASEQLRGRLEIGCRLEAGCRAPK